MILDGLEGDTRIKAVSDDTVFAHDCLRFASRGVGRNLTQSGAIGWNLT